MRNSGRECNPVNDTQVDKASQNVQAPNSTFILSALSFISESSYVLWHILKQMIVRSVGIAGVYPSG